VIELQVTAASSPQPVKKVATNPAASTNVNKIDFFILSLFFS
jgi:hypothetical protein